MSSRARQALTSSTKQQISIEQFTRSRKPRAQSTQSKSSDLKTDLLGLALGSNKRKANDEDDISDDVPSKRLKPTADPLKRSIALPAKSTRMSEDALTKILSPSTSKPKRPAAAIANNASLQLSPVLPTALQDFLHLHKAFLKAMILHIAHNGAVAPVSLWQLLPGASKIWNKRSMSTDDIRRCMPMYGDQNPGFQLYDFGDAGLCIELEDPHSSDWHDSGIDEEGLQSLFTGNLTASWTTWNGPRSPKPASDLEGDAHAFVEALPLADVEAHPSLSKSSTAYSKSLGHSRLELLTTPRHKKVRTHETEEGAGLLTPTSTHPKSSTTITTTATTPSTKTAIQTQTPTPTTTPSRKATPSSRKASLYSRLALKTSTNPTSTPKTCASTGKLLTPSQLARLAERKQALHFLPEMIQTLSLLSKGARKAFSLPELVRVVKESSRGVVEDGVVRAGVGLLGGSDLLAGGKLDLVEAEGETLALAPDFVKIVRIGEGVVGVVVDARGRPGDLETRIGDMIATHVC